MAEQSNRKGIAAVVPIPGADPLDLSFVLDWATQSEKAKIFQIMRENGRQTMNLRTMPTAKLIVLKGASQNKIVGWGGLDYEHNPEFPEVFSQFVFPEYRTYLLGLAIIHSRALIFQKKGFKTGYFRMEAESNADLYNLRTNSGLYEAIPEDQVDLAWKSGCKNCELYQVSCRKQSYLRFDVDRVVDYGSRRLGVPASDLFPKELVLGEEQFRKGEKLVYKARWVA